MSTDIPLKLPHSPSVGLLLLDPDLISSLGVGDLQQLHELGLRVSGTWHRKRDEPSAPVLEPLEPGSKSSKLQLLHLSLPCGWFSRLGEALIRTVTRKRDCLIVISDRPLKWML